MSVAVCQKYARRVIPLLIPDIVGLVRKNKGFPKSEVISAVFVYDFVKRRKEVLCSNPAKITSPTHSSDVMYKDMEDFIAQLSPLTERKRWM